jgi:hypothetical protein
MAVNLSSVHLTLGIWKGGLLELYKFVINQFRNLEPLLELLNKLRDRIDVAITEERFKGSITIAHLVAESRGPHALTQLRILHQLHPDFSSHRMR